jgi:hypothetical protein
MNITEKFIQLTSRTYPHGTESEVFPLLDKNLQSDDFGNLFIKIGESDVMFTAHLDTATSTLTDIKHVFDGNIIKTDGTSILGADDKAGVTIMLNMIENKIPGLYYFFLGEEVGCIGSKKVAAVQKENKIEGINKVISFDRRGTNSIITFQSSARCCSDTFGTALSKALNDVETSFKYENDDTGILTDSVQFVSIYPECTNISVGYYSEHTFSERQDIEHLKKLSEACLKIDWNSLPVERDPKTTEYKSYGSFSRYYGDDDFNYTKTKSNWGKEIEKSEQVWFYDEKYSYVSSIEIQKYSKKVLKVDLCESRIAYEKTLIKDLLYSLDIECKSIDWDGFNLTAHYESGEHKTECNRNDLIEFLPEIDYSSGDDLGDYTGFKNNINDNKYISKEFNDDIWY